MNHKNLKFIFAVLFLVYLPLHSMQKARSLKLHYAIPILGLGYFAKQYFLDQGIYEKFLEQKREEANYNKNDESENEVFYSKKTIEKGLAVETTISPSSHEPGCFEGAKRIITSNKRKRKNNCLLESDSLSFIHYRIKDKKLLKKSCECYIG